jgi:hypothetical protein
MNFIKYRRQIVLLIVTALSTLAFWLIFYFDLPHYIGFPHVTLETLYANYDGPNYMVVSKCGYQKSCIGPNYSLPQPLEYYPAHFPAYPLMISLISVFTSTPKAMLLTTLLGSLLFTLTSYAFFNLYLTPRRSFWLSLFLIFFPARLFVLRQIGAPETWFLFSILASVYFFQKKNYLPSVILAVLAQTLKSPGLLLFIALITSIFFRYRQNLSRLISTALPYLLAPASVLLIFFVYRLQTGDFFAYFHSGDNIHLTMLPFQVFVSNRSWVNTIWLEDVVYILIIAFFAQSRLLKKYRHQITSLFPLIFLLATILVAHRDISRYILPITPFVFLGILDKVNLNKAKMIFFLLLPAVILYSINFCIGNVAPISNWQPYL